MQNSIVDKARLGSIVSEIVPEVTLAELIGEGKRLRATNEFKKGHVRKAIGLYEESFAVLTDWVADFIVSWLNEEQAIRTAMLTLVASAPHDMRSQEKRDCQQSVHLTPWFLGSLTSPSEQSASTTKDRTTSRSLGVASARTR